MNRKAFIKKATGAMLIGIPFYSILSCSDSDTDPISNMRDPNCLLNGTSGSVSANHGHSINVPRADVELGVEKQYSIRGSANHNHVITVSTSDFASLRINQQISVTSTNDSGHIHSVTISCA